MVFFDREVAMSDGGYDDGYKTCGCFWGTSPGSLILKLEKTQYDFIDKQILDVGCGEGKNAAYLAQKGAFVDAYDISKYALRNAHKLCNGHQRINLVQADVTKSKFKKSNYDLIVAYGLLHCLKREDQINELMTNLFKSLKSTGFFILCAFNTRKQNLKAHPDLKPLLLNHEAILSYFVDVGWSIIFSSDEDLFETHPNNNIPHVHSMTRIIAQKLKV